MAHQTVEHVEEHDHPSDGKYIQIALILAALTAAEVATYYVDIGAALGPVLLTMMVVKFSIVAMYFMHLRFDDSLFTKVFTAGIILAVGVYLIALTSFHYFAS
jgi:cytochrome c oxidase subunit 4